jgi:chemotaxis protein methyltransferase CheR
MIDTKQTLALLQLLEGRVGLRLAGSVAQVKLAFQTLALQRGLEPTAFLEELKSDPDLLERFASQFIVPETHFFRVAPQIEALRKIVFPAMRELTRDSRRLRLWSAGCSTGEEAYTLAMLATETLNLRDLEVSVLGTDLHAGSLEVARAGVYGEWSFRDTPAVVREQYFEAQFLELLGNRWSVGAGVRRMTRFQTLNLLSENWGLKERLHLILCRNVTIYFSPSTAQHLIERLAAQLEPGGWLILGPSDPPPLPTTLERAGLIAHFQHGAIVFQKHLEGQVVRVASPSMSLKALPSAQEAGSREAASRESQAGAILSRGIVARNVVAREVPPAPAAVATIPLPPQDADIADLLEAGLHALEADQTSVALEALRRAAYLRPDSALAQFALARAFQRNHQIQRARAALRQSQRALDRLEAQPLEDVGVQDLRRAVAALSVMLEAA